MINIKLRGGALYIAIIVCVVIGITLSMFIMIAGFNQKKVLFQTANTQLQFNLESAFNIAQSVNFSNYENNRWKRNEFNDDSIRIKKLQWGAFSLISAETKNRVQYLKKCGLFGTNAFKDTSLFITDKNKPISLSGKINFTSGCYFPTAGIKPAFIEGQNFNTSSSIHSFLKPSSSALPQIKEELIVGLKKSYNDFNPNTDSIVSELTNGTKNSFVNKTIVYQTANYILNNEKLEGNIKIISSGKLTIRSSCLLDNILIVAKKVNIESGFKGSLHVIAMDSIIIGKDCVFDYPSSFTVVNDDDVRDRNIKGIFFGEKNKVYGAVLAIRGKVDNSATASVMIKLNKDCEVYGLIYSSGYAHLQGKIFGSAFCDKPLIKTPSAVYENHILDCETDSRKYASSIVVPAIFKSINTNACCKWL